MADIPATVPITVPATPEQTFPLWVVESLVFNGNGIEQPLTAEAWFRSARRDATSPTGWILGDQRRNYHIANVWALAGTDSDVASTMTDIIATLTRLATAAGVL
jgi:hypothetical protein